MIRADVSTATQVHHQTPPSTHVFDHELSADAQHRSTVAQRAGSSLGGRAIRRSHSTPVCCSPVEHVERPTGIASRVHERRERCNGGRLVGKRRRSVHGGDGIGHAPFVSGKLCQHGAGQCTGGRILRDKRLEPHPATMLLSRRRQACAWHHATTYLEGGTRISGLALACSNGRRDGCNRLHGSILSPELLNCSFGVGSLHSRREV